MARRWWENDPQSEHWWDKERASFWVLQAVVGVSLLVRGLVILLSGHGHESRILNIGSIVLGALVMAAVAAVFLRRYLGSREDP